MNKRILTFVLLIIAMATTAMAQDLTITKLDMSNFGTSNNSWNYAAFDFKTQTLYPVGINRAESSNSINIWVCNLDFTTTKKSFTITVPQKYSITDRESLSNGNIINYFTHGLVQMSCGYGTMQSDSGGPRIYLTKNLFTKRGLFECVVGCTNNNNEMVYLIIDENSKVLGEIPSDISPMFHFYTMNPIYVEGKTIFSNGLVITDNSSGINSVSADSNPSSVSPNPSNGAASVEINWNYTLLDDAQLNVIDLDGKLVHTQTVRAGNRKASLSTTRFAAGTYIYVVQGSNGYVTTGKLIIN